MTGLRSTGRPRRTLRRVIEDHARTVQDELTAAYEGLAEHARLTARIERAESVLDEAVARAEAARAELVREAEEVADLESFSPARIWASVRGVRVAELDRAEAERQAASYTAARCEAEVARARAELDASRAARAALGDVFGRRDRALGAAEEWVRSTGGPAADELTAIATEVGTLRSTAGELREALDAAVAASQHLAAAGAALEQARGLATYDTFFNGGVVGDMMKYQRVDEAEHLLRGADQALRRLAVELADVGMHGGVPGVEVSQMTRTFDVWFDNIFSDWSVRDRIVRAADGAAAAAHAVALTGRSLETRLADVRAREAELVARREAVLRAATA